MILMSEQNSTQPEQVVSGQTQAVPLADRAERLRAAR